ncbi:MAG: adenylate/guanylate cyclase domain-containing protein [Alphaproteobacteria bacterium]
MDTSDAMAIAPARHDANPAVAHSWSRHPIATWLVEHHGQPVGLDALLEGLCRRLVADGVPLFRVVVGVRSSHPEVAARSVVWEHGATGALKRDFTYTAQDRDIYRLSPVKLIHEGAGAIRRRLEGPDATLDFPILVDLVERGVTDYVIMPIIHTTGQINFVSWTTDRPGGFDRGALTLLYDLLPLIALRVEIEAAYDATRTLLDTYLGSEPARRVLAGRVRRGQVESIRAIILVSDLRGFTALSDRLEPRKVVELLDAYFEASARPIEDGGGEVLKFIGDGLLAIFAIGDDPRRTCASALQAALGILDRLADVNVRRAATDLPPIRCGIGLHVGDVEYGNVGARDRLDFTAVGRAVNEASRVESLCKVLDRPLLTTAPFAHLSAEPRLASLGFHALRGLREPHEIFGLGD